MKIKVNLAAKVGAYWEFSYVYYDKETGNVEKAETCQLKPPGSQMELLLFVTCEGKTANAIHCKTDRRKTLLSTQDEKVTPRKAHFDSGQ